MRDTWLDFKGDYKVKFEGRAMHNQDGSLIIDLGKYKINNRVIRDIKSCDNDPLILSEHPQTCYRKAQALGKIGLALKEYAREDKNLSILESLFVESALDHYSKSIEFASSEGDKGLEAKYITCKAKFSSQIGIPQENIIVELSQIAGIERDHGSNSSESNIAYKVARKDVYNFLDSNNNSEILCQMRDSNLIDSKDADTLLDIHRRAEEEINRKKRIDDTPNILDNMSRRLNNNQERIAENEKSIAINWDDVDSIKELLNETELHGSIVLNHGQIIKEIIGKLKDNNIHWSEPENKDINEKINLINSEIQDLKDEVFSIYNSSKNANKKLPMFDVVANQVTSLKEKSRTIEKNLVALKERVFIHDTRLVTIEANQSQGDESKLSEIVDDVQLEFYNTLCWRLNITYQAASSISSKMISGNPEGAEITLSDILGSIADYVPAFGKGMTLIADILYEAGVTKWEEKIKIYSQFLNGDIVEMNKFAKLVSHELCKTCDIARLPSNPVINNKIITKRFQEKIAAISSVSKFLITLGSELKDKILKQAEKYDQSEGSNNKVYDNNRQFEESYDVARDIAFIFSQEIISGICGGQIKDPSDIKAIVGYVMNQIEREVDYSELASLICKDIKMEDLEKYLGEKYLSQKLKKAGQIATDHVILQLRKCIYEQVKDSLSDDRIKSLETKYPLVLDARNDGISIDNAKKALDDYNNGSTISKIEQRAQEGKWHGKKYSGKGGILKYFAEDVIIDMFKNKGENNVSDADIQIMRQEMLKVILGSECQSNFEELYPDAYALAVVGNDNEINMELQS